MLTQRQSQVLQFIRQSIITNQRPPTFKEIMAEFGFHSTNAVTGHLIALARKQMIDWEQGNGGIKLRNVRIVIEDVQ